ncbi:MAG: WecB/TagA/CpsF family glycosyltransferase [Bacillota bacterium]
MKTGHFDLLGLRIDPVSLKDLTDILDESVRANRTTLVVTLNAETAYLAWRDPGFAGIVNRASLVIPDGAGITWALRYKYGVQAPRLPGIDILTALANSRRGAWRFYFLGGREGAAQKAAENLFGPESPACARTHHGYFSPQEEAGILAGIRAFQPHCLAVGLGAPAQEVWLANRKDQLNVPVLIGVGGAFDCLSGLKARAPEWMRKAGLEWLSRVWREPSRWPRVIHMFRFCLLVLGEGKKHGKNNRHFY